VAVYKVKAGQNQALVDLVTVSPQPRSKGLRYAIRDYAADGTVYEQAPYTEWEWNAVPTGTAYIALLTQFGLNAALTAVVTIYTRGVDFSWVRYNAIAVRPALGEEAEWDRYMLRNVVMLFKDLQAST
jgi:hypothetical protein